MLYQELPYHVEDCEVWNLGFGDMLCWELSDSFMSDVLAAVF